MYMYIAAIVIIRANSAVFDWLTVIYTLIFIYSSKWTAIIHKLRVTEYSAVSLLNSFDCGCKNQSQSPVSRLLHFCARISVSQDSSNIFKQITLASEFNNNFDSIMCRCWFLQAVDVMFFDVIIAFAGLNDLCAHS